MIDDVKSILIVEDDRNDVFLLERAFHNLGFRGEFHVCGNGEEAIRFLGGCRDDCGTPPQIILTDIKMPRSDGFELLRWLKENPWAMVIPTIVLSSSIQQSDIREAYCLGANAYVMKPGGVGRLQAILDNMLRFWSDCEKPTAGVHSPCAVIGY